MASSVSALQYLVLYILLGGGIPKRMGLSSRAVHSIDVFPRGMPSSKHGTGHKWYHDLSTIEGLAQPWALATVFITYFVYYLRFASRRGLPCTVNTREFPVTSGWSEVTSN